MEGIVDYMTLTEEEEKIQKSAVEFARKNKKEIAKRLTDVKIYLQEQNPVSVFMAGSPGAGKTEASKTLLENFSDDGSKILCIDPDELRHEFKAYTGDNSWLFQGAVSVLVDRVHDLALQQKQSFLLDGTLSRYEIAENNIKRSLKRGRVVQILYVYQEPNLAWEFVKAREAEEGRRINPEHFIDQYFAARDVVNHLKNKFKGDIRVDLLLKNFDNSHRLYKANIDKIDHHIPEKYSRDDIEDMLGIR